ncbi:hypothetical protein ACT6QG_02445 [Xanthobacter sp. TB0136]|uniref:hypothetical protein n=1 Tax=Xanthobacter sp. TB0136 TaxID=3459177 RepID=UPI004039AEB8
MYCAECSRCGQRTLLEDEAIVQNPPGPAEGPAEAQVAPRLRCDMCGSRNVKLKHFDSRYEALSYTLQKKG